ncbi:MAG: hypothetical protein R3C15_03425 [Thermoleophilia bacterium]
MRGQATRVSAPDGREWSILVRAWRWPRWRPVRYEPLADPDDDTLGWSAGLVLVPLAALVARGVVPAVRLALALPATAGRSLVGWRWVEARADDAEELAWRTPRRHASAVLDQVARQLALGHEPAPYNTIRE